VFAVSWDSSDQTANDVVAGGCRRWWSWLGRQLSDRGRRGRRRPLLIASSVVGSLPCRPRPPSMAATVDHIVRGQMATVSTVTTRSTAVAIHQWELMRTGDVWQWMCRVLSENVANSNWKCPVGRWWSSRRLQICEWVGRKCSISEVRKKSFPLVSPCLIEIVCSASVIVRMGKMVSICPDRRGRS